MTGRFSGCHDVGHCIYKILHTMVNVDKIIIICADNSCAYQKKNYCDQNVDGSLCQFIKRMTSNVINVIGKYSCHIAEIIPA